MAGKSLEPLILKNQSLEPLEVT
ncbi:hypothetical protein Gohar_028209 [Gossypium harknessii]|uniref:Uncharacterized protein n=1 Tax=Gossypium harknessii TaxID=34285 RepID=A0A7J9I798_9ROSI|nr:hypothetical protein [Gossypium harknessii]